MSKYHKIHAPWRRSRETGEFLAEWSRPEFGFLSEISWHWSEKLDGTNIRVVFRPHDGRPPRMEIRGRTDNAQLPTSLLVAIEELLPVEKLTEQFAHGAVLYGEGIGPKIQKAGVALSPDGPTFVLFDVRVGETWLDRSSVRGIAASLNVLMAPEHRTGNIWAAVEYVKNGFASELLGAVPGTPAEGLVLRPYFELLDRRAHRIITKIKTRDFRK